MCLFLGSMYSTGAPADLSWLYEDAVILDWLALGLIFYIWAALNVIEAREPRYNKYKKITEIYTPVIFCLCYK